MQAVTKGIVLRTKASGDNRLVTLLTEDYGVIDAVARGANTPRGKLTGATEQFCYSDFSLFIYRGSNTIDYAEVEEPFFELRGDLEGLALASYFAQLCCDLGPREEKATDYLRLLLNCIHMVLNRKKPLGQLKAIFELRLLTMAGFMPDLTGCAICGQYHEEQMFFSIENGSLYCKSCVGQTIASPVPTGVLAAMRHIIYSDFSKLFSFSLPDDSLHILEGFSERYLLMQTQRQYPTLDFYRSIAGKG